MIYSWTEFLLCVLVILCLYLVFSKVFAHPFLICQFKHFIALCPACEQLSVADNDISFDLNVAAYWGSRNAVRFPYNPAIQKLRRKLFSIRSGSNDELNREPLDPNISIKLIDFYVQNGRLHEAYNRAFETKFNFVPNLFWYQRCAQLCKTYKNEFPVLLDEEFYGNYLKALERTVALSVQDVKMPYKIMSETVALLASFDELLYETTTLKNPSRQFLYIIDHMRGQLYFITALILYRKSKQLDLDWSEMIKSVTPLLSYSVAKCFNPRPVETEDKLSEILNTCKPVGIYRTQQAGYILGALGKMFPEHFIERKCHIISNWKHRVCEMLYNTSNYRNVTKASAFMSFDETSIALENIPEYNFDNVDEFLSISEIVYPSSLHHLVWIGVQYLLVNEKSICDSVLPSNFSVQFTRPLKILRDSSSSFIEVEDLSKIDLEAFLFACIYCAKATLDHRMDENKPQFPNMLPADVSQRMCSSEQDLWWDYVNQTAIKDRDSEDAKSFIRKRIENLRLTGHRVLPLQLLVLLGRTFANKAVIESDSAQAVQLKFRARLYWEAALVLLKSPDPINRCSVRVASESMFEYPGIITLGEAAKLIFEGSRFIEMLMLEERTNVDSVVSEENSNEPSTAAAKASQPFCSANETSLKALLEQNTLLMNKLEELSNIQVQQIDDVLSTPERSNVDVLVLPVSEQPASLHTKSQISNLNVNQSISSSPMSVTEALTAPNSSQVMLVTNSSASFSPVLAGEMYESSASAVEHNPIADVKATTSLPNVVAVKTGEKMKILFENRVKLYWSHFFEDVWKERGVGQLQILKSPANDSVRIVMLQEDTLETCADHRLREIMTLKAKGDRGWVYSAQDLAVNKEALYTKLCVKFQTYEIANEFYRIFNENKPTFTKTTEASRFHQPTTALSHSSLPTTPVFTPLPLVSVGNEAVQDTIRASFSNALSPAEKTAVTDTQPGDMNANMTFSAVLEKKETLIVNEDEKTQSASIFGFSLNDPSRSNEESKFSSAMTNSENFKGFTKPVFTLFDTKSLQTKLPDETLKFRFRSATENLPKQNEDLSKLSLFKFNAQPILSAEPKKMDTAVVDDGNKEVGSSLPSSESKSNLCLLPTVTTSSTPVLTSSFNEASVNATQQLSEVPKASATPTSTTAAAPTVSVMLENFLSRWKCKKCHVANKKERMVCVACCQPRDGVSQLDGSKATVDGISESLTARSFSVPAAAISSACNSGSSANVLTTVNSTCQVSASVTTPFCFGNASSQPVDRFASPPGTSNSSSYSADMSRMPSKSCDNEMKPTDKRQCPTDLSCETAVSTTNAARCSLPTSAVASSSASAASLFSMGTTQESLSKSRRFTLEIMRSANFTTPNEFTSPSRNYETLQDAVCPRYFFTSRAQSTNGSNVNVFTSLPVTSNGVLTTTSSKCVASRVPAFNFGNSSSKNRFSYYRRSLNADVGKANK